MPENPHTKIRVYTDMVGDLFHWGHVSFLERARALGTELWVGVHADEDVSDFKRQPIMRYEERVKVIAACRYVDNIVPHAPLFITDDLLDQYEIDIVVHGDDFSPEVLKSVYGVPLRRGMLRTLAYTPGISTTEIIRRLNEPKTTVRVAPSHNGAAIEALRGTTVARLTDAAGAPDAAASEQRRAVLLNPGPVNLDERVREALSVRDMCHREPDAFALLAGLRQLVTEVSGGAETHSAVVLTGSGTSAVEATIASVIPADGNLLVLSNGHFAERIGKIAAVNSIRHQILDVGWGQTFDLPAISGLLAGDPTITHVAMVHHETSTGQLNPVDRIGALVAEAGRSLIVDAVSSFGAEDLDVVRDRIDWCITSANKCIEAPPGLSFVIGSPAAVGSLAEIPPRSFYLDLHGHFEAQGERSVPLFTPSIPLMAATRTALELLVSEGVLARRSRYRRLAKELRGGLVRMGLSLYLKDDDCRSSSCTNVSLPDGIGFIELRDRLIEDRFVIYPCNEQLPSYFRVANMGDLKPVEVDRFLTTIGGLIAEFGHVAPTLAA